jgi:hypothetical protein
MTSSDTNQIGLARGPNLRSKRAQRCRESMCDYMLERFFWPRLADP